jgi:general nucleoside transport system permease protein
MLDQVSLMIIATLSSGTVIGLAALGLLMNEKAGVVNLGAEGMMLLAALTGFAVSFLSGSVWLGFLCAALVGAVSAGLLGAMIIWLNTNQYASGLALSLFGTGLSAFVGLPFVGKTLAQGGAAQAAATGWASLHPMVFVNLALAIGFSWFLYRSRAGLVLRAVGESPEAAHALGYPVRRIRLLAMMVGGACCGLAGAFLSVIYTPLWVEGMTAGRGWIALALTTFATWRPSRVLFGAYLFGGITMMQFYLQGQGVQISSHLLSMLPYIATIVVLVLMSRNPIWIRLNMPASLGKPFSPS